MSTLTPDELTHAVVIAGGGPTGLMLAGELALAGVDVAIVERRASQDLAGSRAGGLHARTIEVLDQRGIADGSSRRDRWLRSRASPGSALDISDFPTRHHYGLALWQNHIERILAGWVGELGVPIYRGREVTGFAQDDTGVDVELSDGQSLRAEYLVGCDGGRSVIRKAAGIEFPGWDPTISYLIAEVEMARSRRWASAATTRACMPWQAGGRRSGAGHGDRAAASARPASPTLRDLSEALIAVYGTDYGVHSATWISRFTDMTRQAASYRKGRVLLAGDAAHVHSPVGRPGPQHRRAGRREPGLEAGPGGQRDVAREPPRHLPRRAAPGRCPRAAEHHGADRARCRRDDRIEALRDTMSELLSMDEPRKRFAAMMSGLDIRYDLGDGHPLLGRRMPDLDLVTAERPAAGLHPAARRPAGAAQPRRARRPRHHALGRTGSWLVDAEYAARGSSRCSARSLLPRPC